MGQMKEKNTIRRSHDPACAPPPLAELAQSRRPSLPGEMPILLIHALLAYRQIFGQQNPA
jgi:hypothetical protein